MNELYAVIRYFISLNPIILVLLRCHMHPEHQQASPAAHKGIKRVLLPSRQLQNKTHEEVDVECTINQISLIP